jgi:hypothetical protein
VAREGLVRGKVCPGWSSGKQQKKQRATIRRVSGGLRMETLSLRLRQVDEGSRMDIENAQTSASSR